MSAQKVEGEGLRWTLYRPGDDEILGHVNADVRVIGDDLPGKTLVMPVEEHEAARERWEGDVFNALIDAGMSNEGGRIDRALAAADRALGEGEQA